VSPSELELILVERDGRMLAAFSQELDKHKREVATILQAHTRKWNDVLTEFQNLVETNRRLILERDELREEVARLNRLVATHDEDRPSVQVVVQERPWSERPMSSFRPKGAAGWLKLGLSAAAAIVAYFVAELTK